MTWDPEEWRAWWDPPSPQTRKGQIRIAQYVAWLNGLQATAPILDPYKELRKASVLASIVQHLIHGIDLPREDHPCYGPRRASDGTLLVDDALLLEDTLLVIWERGGCPPGTESGDAVGSLYTVGDVMAGRAHAIASVLHGLFKAFVLSEILPQTRELVEWYNMVLKPYYKGLHVTGLTEAEGDGDLVPRLQGDGALLELEEQLYDCSAWICCFHAHCQPAYLLDLSTAYWKPSLAEPAQVVQNASFCFSLFEACGVLPQYTLRDYIKYPHPEFVFLQGYVVWQVLGRCPRLTEVSVRALDFIDKHALQQKVRQMAKQDSPYRSKSKKEPTRSVTPHGGYTAYFRACGKDSSCSPQRSHTEEASQPPKQLLDDQGTPSKLSVVIGDGDIPSQPRGASPPSQHTPLPFDSPPPMPEHSPPLPTTSPLPTVGTPPSTQSPPCATTPASYSLAGKLQTPRLTPAPDSPTITSPHEAASRAVAVATAAYRSSVSQGEGGPTAVSHEGGSSADPPSPAARAVPDRVGSLHSLASSANPASATTSSSSSSSSSSSEPATPSAQAKAASASVASHPLPDPATPTVEAASISTAGVVEEPANPPGKGPAVLPAADRVTRMLEEMIGANKDQLLRIPMSERSRAALQDVFTAKGQSADIAVASCTLQHDRKGGKPLPKKPAPKTAVKDKPVRTPRRAPRSTPTTPSAASSVPPPPPRKPAVPRVASRSPTTTRKPTAKKARDMSPIQRARAAAERRCRMEGRVDGRPRSTRKWPKSPPPSPRGASPSPPTTDWLKAPEPPTRQAIPLSPFPCDMDDSVQLTAVDSSPSIACTMSPRSPSAVRVSQGGPSVPATPPTHPVSTATAPATAPVALQLRGRGPIQCEPRISPPRDSHIYRMFADQEGEEGYAGETPIGSLAREDYCLVPSVPAPPPRPRDSASPQLNLSPEPMRGPGEPFPKSPPPRTPDRILLDLYLRDDLYRTPPPTTKPRRAAPPPPR